MIPNFLSVMIGLKSVSHSYDVRNIILKGNESYSRKSFTSFNSHFTFHFSHSLRMPFASMPVDVNLLNNEAVEIILLTPSSC